jgi:hypothetical protein
MPNTLGKTSVERDVLQQHRASGTGLQARCVNQEPLRTVAFDPHWRGILSLRRRNSGEHCRARGVRWIGVEIHGSSAKRNRCESKHEGTR